MLNVKSLFFGLIAVVLLSLNGFSGISTNTPAEKEKILIQSYTSPEAKVGDTVKCPVMGTKFKVNKNSLNVTVKGKKYYLCCQMCTDPLKKDPDKYLKVTEKVEVKMQNYSTDEAKVGDVVKCPVMGSDVTVTDKTLFASIKGKKYYTCCGGCPDMIKKNPDKYLKPSVIKNNESDSKDLDYGSNSHSHNHNH